MSTDLKSFYTVTELANVLDVSVMTIYRWVQEHPDDVIRMRRSIRIKGDAVRRLLEGK